MVACAILFVGLLAILTMVSSAMKNSRLLQRPEVDAGMAAAQVFQLFKTNREPDLFLEGDFGRSYPDFSWTAESSEYATNGLLEVDIVVTRRGVHNPVDTLSILVFNPDVRSRLGRGPLPR